MSRYIVSLFLVLLFCGCSNENKPIEDYRKPVFMNLNVSVTDASPNTADGSATLSTSIFLYSETPRISQSGFVYSSDVLDYVSVDCGASSNPSCLLEDLYAGEYTVYSFVTLSDGVTFCGDSVTFTINEKSQEGAPSFSAISITTADASQKGAQDGSFTCSFNISYSGSEVIKATGFRYRLPSSSSYTEMNCGTEKSILRTVSSLPAGDYSLWAFVTMSSGKEYTSSIKSFTIGEKGDTPHTSKYSWAELPVIIDENHDGRIDTDTNLYYAYHLCAGKEKNAQGNATARNYTVCYSAEHHCPLWVAAPRHSRYNGSSGRTDSYKQDPDIPSSIQIYSKETGGGCNKGHMLGSNERTCSSATNAQVFYYSNIAPQKSSTFNTGGGAWNNLEDWVDGKVCSDTLYVVIGCHFDRFTDKYNKTDSPSRISFGGRNDVSCPTMFYYAMLRTKNGRSGKSVANCSANELQCVAICLRHSMEKGHEPQAKDLLSVTELEKLTGVTFFQNVPNAPKSSYSASDWGL